MSPRASCGSREQCGDVIPGCLKEANPESRDSGSGATHHPGMTENKVETLRMNADTDAKLIEAGRKLFAGDWQFVWASPSIETLPPMEGLEIAFAGRSNVGKSSLI